MIVRTDERIYNLDSFQYFLAYQEKDDVVIAIPTKTVGAFSNILKVAMDSPGYEKFLEFIKNGTFAKVEFEKAVMFVNWKYVLSVDTSENPVYLLTDGTSLDVQAQGTVEPETKPEELPMPELLPNCESL